MYPANMQLNAIALAVTLAWVNIARAEGNEEDELAWIYGDKTTVSIATGAQQPLRIAPSTATVITAQDIKAMGATDLSEVLRLVPGLHVSVSLVAYDPRYLFRGIATERNAQALVLVNGFRTNTYYFGNRGTALAGHPLANVERIEVIRGPGSALYGADAFSGVINIITKDAANIHGTEYGVRLGSFHSRDAWVQYGGKLGALDAAFYMQVGKTNGQRELIESDLQTILDGVFGTRASFAPGPLSLERESLELGANIAYKDWRLRANYSRRKTGVAVGLIESRDPEARFPTDRLYLELAHQKNLTKDLNIATSLKYTEVHEDPAKPLYTILPAGTFAGAFPNGILANPGHSERQYEFGMSAMYTRFNKHRIRVGVGYRKEDVYKVTELKNFTTVLGPTGPVNVPLPGGLTDATGNPDLAFLLPQSRNVTYTYVQDEWNFTNDWILTAGIRKDRYSDFGNTTNPRVALVWNAARNLSVKALYGEAFRAPSAIEQYGRNNPSSTGNPHLQPETIKTNELALSWQPKPNLQTNLTFFYYREKNIIRFVPNPDRATGSTAQNTGDQVGRGLELEATWDPARTLRLSGSFSLQRSIDLASGVDAGLAPRRRIFARADWRFFPTWELGTTINHVADRRRQAGDTRPKIADYTTVDLILRKEKLWDTWSARVVVQNLFDKDAREPAVSPALANDLPLAPRALNVQLQRNF